MFKIEPDIFTVKDVSKALRVTPGAIQKSISRTGMVRGVKVNRKQGMIFFTRAQFNRITS